MSNNANSRRKVEMPGSIRSKFVAALCMLLVSAIMFISSTYAWFTLSTAPEVKGITTQVGANGNLEMALLNSDSYSSTADDLGIKSDIGDSMTIKDAVEANITWGNLVDLGHASYGLGNVLLMPSKLNVTTVGEGDAASNFVDSNSLLLAPSYGSDGRVIDVREATYTANYNATGGNFKYNSDATAAGVRAIGTSSDVSVRFSAYRSALSAAQTATSNAVSAAQRSLSSNAQDIAALLVRKAASGATEFDVKYLNTIESILDGVEAANEYIENAIIQYVLAYRLSANGDTLAADADVEALVSAATTMTWVTDWAGTATDKPNGLDDALATYNGIASAVSTGRTKLAAIRDKITANNVDTSTNPYILTWGDGNDYDIGPVFDTLVNRTGATVAGKDATTAKDELIQAAVDSFMATGTIPIVLGEGSGVYYDIASACGSYTVPTTINGDDLGNSLAAGMTVNATITASTGSDPSSLSVVRGAFTSDTAPSSSVSAGSDMILSDTYGYALDFGFRTNAANSKLLLQTAAAQRVYTDSVSSTTQGLGSNLKFTTNDVNTFTLNDVRGLMSAVRIAFVTPGENGAELLAMAKLDITATPNADGTVTYTGGTEDGNAVSADLFLCDYTVDAGGVVKVADKKTGTDAVITDLAQNKAKKITVIVYLDGEEVDNTMVANAEKSVTGNLNLQFSSSATLVPMVNSSLMATVDKSQLDPYTVPADVMNTLKQQYPGLAGANVTFWQTKTTPKAYYYSLDGGTTLSPITLPTAP